jgi:hypothetical protein
MSNKIVKDDGRDFIFPVFKFQKEEHATSMWQNGNMYLANPRAFRKGAYGGLIDDDREGQVTLYYPFDDKACYDINHSSETVSIDDVFIYCGSSDFFSDTLKWAMSDGKETCVLITDVDEVARIVASDVSGLEYIGTQQCIYSGRDIGTLDFFSSIRQNVSQNPILAGWVKPLKHAPQKEVRMMWKADPSLANEDNINLNVDVQRYMIPVSFSGVEALLADTSQVHTVGARVVTVDGCNDAWFDIQYPLETFSPVIHKSNGEHLLGFLSPSSVLSGGRFHGGIGMCITRVGAIGCNVLLKDVVRIEYRVNN